MSVFFLVPMASLLAGSLLSEPGAQGKKERDPEKRALAYLAREVPRWSRENKCYSCHNNGDAARALYRAMRLSFPVPDGSLEEESKWLARPEQWDHNGGEGPYSDKKLARIQFAAALVEAVNAGQAKKTPALIQAADLVLEHQDRDGSWQVSAAGTAGSPATYGTCLATYQARQVLHTADPARYHLAIAKADRWLGKVSVNSVLDAGALLLALAESPDAVGGSQRQRCLALIKKGQASSGGWGPYINSPPESFDTAVVLLGLTRCATSEEGKTMIRRGRDYLLSAQQADGSWPETTRPSGSESYAQRVSTTAWATLALMATR
jgi:Squalene-hopene cyclase C-terminal domain